MVGAVAGKPVSNINLLVLQTPSHAMHCDECDYLLTACVRTQGVLVLAQGLLLCSLEGVDWKIGQFVWMKHTAPIVPLVRLLYASWQTQQLTASYHSSWA
jgi:hypothetical protein